MKILQIPDKILNEKCEPFYKFSGVLEPDGSVAAMAEFIRSNKRCVGLAANQIGIKERFFVMREGYARIRYCFNPEILGHGKQLEIKPEGCMSITDGTKFFQVPRWRVITARYLDETGKSRTLTLTGLEARIFQHEVEHLNGLLIVKTEVKDV